MLSTDFLSFNISAYVAHMHEAAAAASEVTMTRELEAGN
jgi:hypothetical protein